MAAPADVESSTQSNSERTRRWGRRGMLVLIELIHAVLFIPLVVAALPLLLAFHLAVPLAAEAGRTLARAAGANAPSAVPPGASRWAWLTGRIAHAAFWRQDLPLLLSGTLLSGIGFFIAAVGGPLVGVLVVSPFIASPEHPIELTLSDLPGWSRTATSFGQIWWTLPIALFGLVLAVSLLAALGCLRCRMTTVLSRPDDEARLAALTAEVGHLTSGRATLVDAFDAERARIERDLHDGAQQRLVALAMRLGTAELHADRLAALDDAGHTAETGVLAALRTDIRSAQEEVEAALRSLRDTVHGIRPAILTERGLVPALRDLAGRAPLPTTVAIAGEDTDLAAITSPVATTVYFAVTEALTNAAKHAGPDARARVELTATAQGLSVIVVDDGAGGADPHAPGSTGLAGMAQRVESVGGRLTIGSPPGVGTRLTLTVPLTPPWARG
ncbi:sensor histidine kinase [Actinomyces ruminicola]|uniref:histidine kinase n=1 Tax=Actinomyces ruminicola TaxID=332524 RepID=A0A1G9V148_9ACTO|nr:ATP-binding protein [Actinomyces ruminicola]SDM65833.1 Signal transduction histidine kinase [Actinomyces ruminicola]